MQVEEKHPRIIATRVPPALALELEKAAERELLSVFSYVRRLILLAVNGDRRAAPCLGAAP
jgi:hypothetical protein